MLEKVPAPKLQWLAIILFAFYPLAILAARLDLMHFRNSFLIFIVSALIGFIVFALAVLKLSRGSGNASQLVVAIVFTALPIGLLGSNVLKARSVPFIHDITTDTQNPPQLIAAAKVRTGDDHDVAYAGEEVAKLQLEGYPDLTSLELNAPVEKVAIEAKAVVQALGWEILDEQLTQSPMTLEAVDESLLFGFKDDIAIRLTSFVTPEQHVDVPAKTRVDVRSMSRQGKSDLGANAKRIRVFLEALQARI
ncbi:MAG: DUF1499 domain-containing protein [Gammaproteobacteria bacterium]|nr:DUF1499 domain-containing protein [Gammaproteobacteria bacterium]